MVWDREAKGPATFNGHRAAGLTEWQANEIKNELTNKSDKSVSVERS
jgi:hypothetical protein